MGFVFEWTFEALEAATGNATEQQAVWARNPSPEIENEANQKESG